MKAPYQRTLNLFLLAAACSLSSLGGSARAQGTAFTYQGRLNDSYGPATGSYDLKFALFGTNVGGVAITGWVASPATAVSNGLFTTTIDFGAVFDGTPRWLELAVETNGSAAGYVTLGQRQQLNPAPYAIFAGTAGAVSGTIGLQHLPATLLTNGASGVNLVGTFVGDGSGLTNLTLNGALNLTTPQVIYGGSPLLYLDTIHNFYAGLAGNTSTTAGSNTASGFQALHSNTNGYGNTASGYQALYSNTNGFNNTASGFQALYSNTTGWFNTASGAQALASNTTGKDNTASGDQTLYHNTTGYDNTAFGFIALQYNTTGWDNTAIGTGALVANTNGNFNTACGDGALGSNTTGYDNTACGFEALVNATGNNNLALGAMAGYLQTTGSYNIAIGMQAGYNQTTGSSNICIGNLGVSSDNNIVRIGSKQTATYLAGTVYANGVALTSDRNAKENFAPVDPQAVLASVAALKVTRWNYKGDSADRNHIGPVAQDFHAAFEVNGADETHISVVDEGGVALAAIQGLNQKLNKKDAEIADLKARLERMEKLLSASEEKHCPPHSATTQLP